MNWKKLLKWLATILLGVALLVLAGAGGLWGWLRASLPKLDGERCIGGLTARVVIERDALGVPTIRATNRLDAARALGFLHAQDRFFQMDLMRREAAGELAELFGPAVLKKDKAARRHRFRARASVSLQRASASQLQLVSAYTDGVNAGLRTLGARPPEYLLLRLTPQPWRNEDSCLVACAMFMDLQDSDGGFDTWRAVVRKALPPAAAEFFAGPARAWEAPLDNSEITPPPIPTAIEFSYAALAGLTDTDRSSGNAPRLSALSFRGTTHDPTTDDDDDLIPGSNNWAVDGVVSGTGAAIVCNDMHLGLSVPVIWYRARLVFHDPELGAQDLVGVTLPGVAPLVAGSNRHIAWGFTDAYVDTTDLVRLEMDPANPRRYRTPDGWREFQRHEETICVHGQTNVTLIVDETLWGPVVQPRGLDGPYALAWIAQDPNALNWSLLQLERARDAKAALRLAPTIGMPVSNFLVGDRQGHIGYTLIGPLPNRFGFDGVLPRSWADGSCGWRGLLPAERYPRLLDPADGRFWSANNRTLGTPEYRALNPEFQDQGARARQIRDDLRALPRATETNLWSIYHDDRALFLARWQKLLLQVLDRHASTNAEWREMRTLAEAWAGRASADSQGYRLVRSFRHEAIQLLLEPVNTHLAKAAPGVSVNSEDAAWALVTQQPAHLLNPRFANFDALLRASVDRVLVSLRQQKLTLAQATWGQRNTLKVQHPLSLGLPRLARWLDMPSEPMPGDNHMPRVQSPGGGVSERLVVSPGHEERGLFNLPGGQSGHFLSPFYRAGFTEWVRAEPLPLLPGPARHTLALRPSTGS